MAKNDQEEAFEKVMSATLSRTLDLLKFAEAKNAALLTFSSAWIIASATLLKDHATLIGGFETAFSVALPLFVLAALISIVSFLPKASLDRFNRDNGRAKSLLFFGDIATMEAAEFRERARTRYMPPEGTSVTDSYLDDLAVQISQVSRLAARKFWLFNWAARAVLLAILVLAAPPLSWLSCHYLHVCLIQEARP